MKKLFSILITLCTLLFMTGVVFAGENVSADNTSKCNCACKCKKDCGCKSGKKCTCSKCNCGKCNCSKKETEKCSCKNLKKKLKNAVVKIANVINQNAKKLQKINVIVKNVNVQKSVNVLKIVNATNVNVQII